ncbi:MAG: D-2-hydroxyacid dehydrogenase [Bacteroidales bacterium]|nr:D-2-hydroxyacid dehydrogenase [Bacteroidales bacterium]
MKIVFLDASTLGAASLEPIKALGDLVCYPYSSPQEALERVKEAEVLIINKVKVTTALMDAAPKLKLICEAATGVNNIDLEAAAARGIPVKNVAGYSTDSVVQLTFALILNLLCRTASYDNYVKSGAYSASPIFTEVSRPFTELAGKTMGIVGMGTIGQRVAKAAEAFGMKVIYFSTSGTSHCKDYPSVSIDTLMQDSDVVSIHAPLNARTNGLIGARELSLMRPTAIIINIGRGGIVDEKALADAISQERIAGAGLDVFTSEPLPADNPLLHTAHPERLSFTPHIGWASKEALNRLVQGIASNINP